MKSVARDVWSHEEITFVARAVGTHAVPASLEVVNVGDRQLVHGHDILCFHVFPRFKKRATRFDLIVVHESVPALALCITTNVKDASFVRDVTDSESGRHFLLFTTHQLELTASGDVRCIFVTLENNSLSFSDLDQRVQLEPHIDVFQVPLASITYESLPYLPLHPDDPLLEGQLLRAIPQRTPCWFALRAFASDTTIVSGTSMGKYCCGYWLEDINVKMDEQRHSKTVKQVVRDKIQSANNMRFGRLQEDAIMLIVMHNYAQWKYFEYGSIALDMTLPSIRALNLPMTNKSDDNDCIYNCSPDGLAWIATQTWASFPAATAAHYKRYDDIDCKRCLLEYKASYRSTKLPDYYLPQLYLGMMATGSCMAMLVRYKRRRGQSNGGRWTTMRECNAYIIYRDPVLEQKMIRNLRLLFDERPRDCSAYDWINVKHRGPYDELKADFKRVADYTIAKALIIPSDLVDEHERRRYNTVQATKRLALDNK